ncbi:hypothetical protein EVG20_g144 [Dentipellis fragilis]|uniref:Cupin type-2 domain-containing protein n=1 Tax=Dentipellis fragilis TaxID=205917 RepID=A0A4Y9ZDK4_9AGAM|nr:hypothetical protein EVG20_g144 [Dentipellis fragilis]
MPSPLRRVVTGLNQDGLAVVTSDELLLPEAIPSMDGALAGTVWVTAGLPTNDNNIEEVRTADGIVTPGGTNCRFTDLAPGARTPMHKTDSVDYNILIQGQVIHITEDGVEKLLTNPGDTVIQRGTMHAWKNPGEEWARWVSVIIDAIPVSAKPQ